MKKSKGFATVLFILFIALPLATVTALDFRNEYFPGSSDLIEITMSMEDLPLSELKDLLASGETSRIEFEARLFQKRRGILSFVGDQVLETQNRYHRIRYDRINQVFTLETPSGTKYYRSFTSLIRPFRTTRFTFRLREDGECYLKTRVILVYRELVPPFNLLESIFPETYHRLDWKRVSRRTGETRNSSGTVGEEF